MKNILLLLFLIPNILLSQGPSSCACVWSDANGDLNCFVGNCGGGNWSACYNQVSTPNLMINNLCPQPSGTNCNPYQYNTSLNGSCWYQGNGCSGTVVCDYVQSLPVELSLFYGENSDDINIIKWETESEYNSDHFILYRSITDKFTENNIIGYTQSVGNSNVKTKYFFYDEVFPKEINYYLLIQMDIDGKYTEYGPISIDNRVLKNVIVKTVNLLGQEIDDNYIGIVIDIYEDGSTIKRIK